MGRTKEFVELILAPKDIIKKYLIEHPAPARGLILDIVEYRDRYGIRLYRNNFNDIPDSKQQDVVKWLEQALMNLNNLNSFVVTLDMEAEVVDKM